MGSAVLVSILAIELVSCGRRNFAELPTFDVSSRVRLTKTPAEYLAVRGARRELPYEAMLTTGRETWAVGERVHIYRARGGGAGIADQHAHSDEDSRDYDDAYYVRHLRETFAARLTRAFDPDDFATVFADPDQLTLFPRSLATVRTVLL